MGISYPGRARINPASPEALGICDRCGLQYNLRDLRYQQRWAGTQLITTRLRVCDRCWDDPTEQLRSIRLPPDPISVNDPRTEDFSALEKNFLEIKKYIGWAYMFGENVSSMNARLTISPAKFQSPMFEGSGDLGANISVGYFINPVFSDVSDASAIFSLGKKFVSSLSDTSDMSASLTADFNLSPAFSDVSDVSVSLTAGFNLSPAFSDVSDVTADLTIPFIISFRSSATSTAETVTGPSDIASGDLLVLLDRAANNIKSGDPGSVVPSGFTVIDSAFDSINVRQILSYKIADGSEASASITGMVGDTNTDKVLLVFQGSDAIGSVSVQDVSSEMTNSNPASQSITASGGTTPLIVLGGYGALGAIDPRTWTGGTPSEVNSSTLLYLLYEIFNSSPSDITIDMDDEGSDNCLQGCYLECSS